MDNAKPKSSILYSISYYIICLGLIGTFQLTNLFPNTYHYFIGLSLILSLITGVYAIPFWNNLQGLLRYRTIKWKPLVLMAVLTISLGSLVHSVPEWINQLRFHESYQTSLLFWDSAAPQLYALIFLCIQPALIEELAFRGFIYSNLNTRFSTVSTIFLTALLFAALHLSIWLLYWLVPLGLLFAYFRHRYQSLWYGVTGHFCYNFTIIFWEFYHNWQLLQ